MSDIISMVILKSDKRQVASAIEIMTHDMYKNIVKMIFIVLITILCLIVTSYTVNAILFKYMIFKGATTLMSSIINYKITTAYMVRLGKFKFIFKIINMTLFNIKIGITRHAVSRTDLVQLLKVEAEKEYKLNKKQWSQLDKEMKDHKYYNIDQYWEKKGLTIENIKHKTNSIRFSATEPNNPNLRSDYCIDMRDHLPLNNSMKNLVPNWMRSDMSDDMHVKSIYKRLCPTKYIINFDNIDVVDKIVNDQLDYLPKIKITYYNKILRALATSGSPGQFSKRSAYEEIWKNKLSKDGVEIWTRLIKNLLYLIMINGYIHEDLVQFMLYRKMEATDSKNNEPKPTRLMNSPNLVCRIIDSVVFSEFNDSMVDARYHIPSSLGINIFLELKLLHIKDDSKVYIVADYADYDGSQHPVQGFAVAKARINYMIRNNDDIENICYVLPKYRKHMRRQVRSTFGITYDVIGHQASGDNTTSDDNTSKTSGVTYLYIKEMATQGMIYLNNCKEVNIYNEIKLGNIGIDVTGDDSGIMVQPTDKFNIDAVRDMYTKLTNSVGWAIKPESFDVKVMNGQELEYLSHSVRDTWFKSKIDEIEICFPCVVRPKERKWGKFFIAPEISNIMSRNNKSKLMSKYMTLAMVSIGDPVLIVASIQMMLLLRAPITDHVGSYSWAGIKAETINSIRLNNAIKLQLGRNVSQNIEHIKIDKNNLDQFKVIGEETNKIYNELVIKNKRLNLTERNLFHIDDENYWNYGRTIELIQILFTRLDRHGLITQLPEEEKWWTALPQNITINNEVEEPRQRSITCNHLDIINIEKIFDKTTRVKYITKYMCENCYKNRKERRYESIKVLINNHTRKVNHIDNNNMIQNETNNKKVNKLVTETRLKTDN